MKNKQFARLPIAQVLKPQVREILSRWLTINDQEKFTTRIFSTVREMFTVVKNVLAEVPTSQDHHNTHDRLSVTLPRFDKIV